MYLWIWYNTCKLLWSFTIAEFVPENRVIRINPTSCPSFPYICFLKNFSNFSCNGYRYDIWYSVSLTSHPFLHSILLFIRFFRFSYFKFVERRSASVFLVFQWFLTNCLLSLFPYDNVCNKQGKRRRNSYDCKDVWHSRSTCLLDCFYSSKINSIYIFTLSILSCSITNDLIFINDR